VDDEPAALQVRRMVLESQGFRVSTAATAGEALEIAGRERFDLVLTDYYLDGATGGELARALKDSHPLLMVAIYSGADGLPEDAGYADAVVPKGEGVETLIAAVRRLAGGKQEAA
jgi:CheY-like chemotaxis protein